MESTYSYSVQIAPVYGSVRWQEKSRIAEVFVIMDIIGIAKAKRSKDIFTEED